MVFLSSSFLLLKGVIFRQLFHYQHFEERYSQQLTDEAFQQHIQNTKVTDLASIAQQAHLLTAKQLSFTFQAASNQPNELLQTNKANCVGYAALFQAIATLLIQQNGLEDQIEVRHVVGKIHFLGVDLHQIIQHPFFKNHDFNQLHNLKTGELLYTDTSVYDYLHIQYVSKN